MPTTVLAFPHGETLTRMGQVVELLYKAPPSVLPDPRVAAILFDGAGQVLASYNKQSFGEPHSEAQTVLAALAAIHRQRRSKLTKAGRESADNALASLRSKLFTPRSMKNEADLEDVRELVRIYRRPFAECSLFVNLEPCSHFGKNPACAAIIVAAGIGTVVFSHYDPDPDVSGRGERLLKAGRLIVSRGYLMDGCLEANHLFCKISHYMPRLFDGIHPTAKSSRRQPITMLGLLVPRAEIRTEDLGRSVQVHTFGVAPLRHTTERLQQSGWPKVSPQTVHALQHDPDAVLFTTLLNPVAIVDMLHRRFRRTPGSIIAATPDMGFELGKEECLAMLSTYLPRTHVCVGVRMAAIRDKLARISLRRRLEVERKRAGMVALLVLAKGVPSDAGGRVETRFMDLVGATTTHVSRLEEYLVMLRFLRPDVEATLYLGGDLLADRWWHQTASNLQKLVMRAPHITLCCTEEEAVKALKRDGLERVRYLEPYWEVV